MKNVFGIPTPQDGWGKNVKAEIEAAIAGLTFVPVTVYCMSLYQLYQIAEVLNLQVPWKCEEGTLAAFPSLEYSWGTIDGRAVDYLSIKGPYDTKVFDTFITAILGGAVRFERHGDFSITFQSAKLEAAPNGG